MKGGSGSSSRPAVWGSLKLGRLVPGPEPAGVGRAEASPGPLPWAGSLVHGVLISRLIDGPEESLRPFPDCLT